MFRNNTLIHTEVFYGTTKFVIFKLPANVQIIPSTQTVYEFKMKGTRTTTSIAQSVGLVINIETI